MWKKFSETSPVEAREILVLYRLEELADGIGEWVVLCLVPRKSAFGAGFELYNGGFSEEDRVDSGTAKEILARGYWVSTEEFIGRTIPGLGHFEPARMAFELGTQVWRDGEPDPKLTQVSRGDWCEDCQTYHKKSPLREALRGLAESLRDKPKAH